jgi:hypothetical protein
LLRIWSAAIVDILPPWEVPFKGAYWSRGSGESLRRENSKRKIIPEPVLIRKVTLDPRLNTVASPREEQTLPGDFWTEKSCFFSGFVPWAA